MQKISFIEKFDDHHILQLESLFKKNHWSQNRSYKDIKIALKNTTIAVGMITDTNQLIGFGRLLTDHIFRATLYDIIINNENQNKGLGKKLITYILNHKILENVQQIDLCCRPEKNCFYQKWGFTQNLNGSHYLRKKLTN